MKLKNNIFFGLTLIVIILLSAFAHQQNKRRKIGSISINFKSDGPKFLSPSFVNKLLIQNIGELSSETKDSLDLIKLEALLENTPYILNAEVFCFPEGTLGINILEKKPLVMIQGDNTYYLDNLSLLFERKFLNFGRESKDINTIYFIINHQLSLGYHRVTVQKAI